MEPSAQHPIIESHGVPRLAVKIENTYSDGHTSESIHLIDFKPPWENWWEDVVFPLTGDGHGKAAGIRAHHQATIIDGPISAIGLTHEWMD